MNRAEALKELSEMQTESWTDTRQKDAVKLAIEVLENPIKLEDVKRFATENNYALLTTEIYSNAIRTMDAIDEIKTDIEKAKDDFNEYNDYQIGVRQGFRFALEIIENHTRGAD